MTLVSFITWAWPVALKLSIRCQEGQQYVSILET
jgi:hypothetical protein